MKEELTYNIHSGILSGTLDGINIHTFAGSGGRAGSKVKGAANVFLANNALATHVKVPGTHLFGPLPIGTYTLRKYEESQTDRKNWIKLIPDGANHMHGRDGFAIHGRGNVGSHGCIVPYDFSIITKLLKILDDRASKKKSAPKLKVIAVGTDLGWQSRLV